MIVLLVAAALAAPPADCPGWLGFGFTYRTTVRNGRFAGGWMHVQGVAPASPAAKAGLAKFDVITAIDGEPLRYTAALPLLQRLSRVRAGQSLRLTVMRGGAAGARVVTAAASPPERCRAWRDNLDMARAKR